MTHDSWVLPGNIGEEIQIFRWPARPSGNPSAVAPAQIADWLKRWSSHPGAEASLRGIQLQLASIRVAAGDLRQQRPSLHLLQAAFDTGELRAFRRPVHWFAPSSDKKEEPTPGPSTQRTFIEISLADQHGNARRGEAYKITLPDGRTRQGRLDQNGFARVDGLDPGVCDVSFPNIDGRRWRRRS